MRSTPRASAALVVGLFCCLVAGGCRDDDGGETPPPAPAVTKAPTAQTSTANAPTASGAAASGAAASAAAAVEPGATQAVPLGDLGVALTLPPGWEATWKADSELLEVRKGGARFFVERFDPAKEAGLADLSAAVAMVRSFEQDGFLVESLAQGPVAEGFFVAATTRDDMGRVEPHLFVVRDLAGVHLVCRLGPGVAAEDVPTVKRACESLAPTR